VRIDLSGQLDNFNIFLKKMPILEDFVIICPVFPIILAYVLDGMMSVVCSLCLGVDTCHLMHLGFWVENQVYAVTLSTRFLFKIGFFGYCFEEY
jgi:hypothetical protein